MPYTIKKCDKCNCGTYKVVNASPKDTQSGKIHAKGTTLQKAKAQVRLLEQKHEKKSARPSQSRKILG